MFSILVCIVTSLEFNYHVCEEKMPEKNHFDMAKLGINTKLGIHAHHD